MISKGADIEAKDAFGVTPLLAAVYEGTNEQNIQLLLDTWLTHFNILLLDHVDMVKFLVSKGANKSVKGSDGKTAKESTDNADIIALL